VTEFVFNPPKNRKIFCVKSGVSIWLNLATQLLRSPISHTAKNENKTAINRFWKKQVVSQRRSVDIKKACKKASINFHISKKVSNKWLCRIMRSWNENRVICRRKVQNTKFFWPNSRVPWRWNVNNPNNVCLRLMLLQELMQRSSLLFLASLLMVWCLILPLLQLSFYIRKSFEVWSIRPSLNWRMYCLRRIAEEELGNRVFIFCWKMTYLHLRSLSKGPKFLSMEVMICGEIIPLLLLFLVMRGIIWG